MIRKITAIKVIRQRERNVDNCFYFQSDTIQVRDFKKNYHTFISYIYILYCIYNVYIYIKCGESDFSNFGSNK